MNHSNRFKLLATNPSTLCLYLLAILGFTLCACAPSTPPATPTATEPPATPTATFEFPTLAPTPTEGRTLPTPEVASPLAGAGEIIYQTEFEEAGQWPIGQDSLGTVSLGDGTLAAVVPRPGLGRLIRSPAPVQDDFILDVVLRTEVCQATDEFGVAFWLTPDGDHMRFTLTCQGGVRLRRVLGDERRAWVPFSEREPAVLAGAPAENRLTVRAEGDDFRLYVNGFQVIAGTEPTLPAGGSGLVISSSAESSQTTVLFESFTLYALNSQLTPAATESEPFDG